MKIFAAVMTSHGIGAISSIQLFGDKAGQIIEKIFRPVKKSPFKPSKVKLGWITDKDRDIDQVTIACCDMNNFIINCHGNPLIVSEIMELLTRHKVKPVAYEDILAMSLHNKNKNAISIESRLCQIKAKTIEATMLLAKQVESGLTKQAKTWLSDTNDISLEEIRRDISEILKKSPAADLLISGCKILLTGPANSGKSTLLNRFTGRKKAIVADIKGTTRDFVTGSCQIGPLFAELTDTAGIDPTIAKNEINKQARQTSVNLLEKTDVILLVIDINSDMKITDIFDTLPAEKTIVVLNKSDLPQKLDITKLPPKRIVTVSAEKNINIECLKDLFESTGPHFDQQK